MTDAEVKAWLRKGGPSVILVHLGYMYQVGVGVSAVPTQGTKYYSTAPYFDRVTPRAYKDCVTAVPTFTRALDRTTLRGKYSPTVGSLDISNEDGGQDDLLSLAIDGSDVNVYIGDPTWAFTDFVHLFTAVSLLASAPSLQTIRVMLKDHGLLLNKSIGGTTAVGGTGPSATLFRPFNFGWVHQVDPILLDATVGGGKYAHSDTGTNTAAVAVRNDGVSVTFTDNADGTFTLTTPPAGNEKITCDVLATRAGGTDIGYRISDLIATVVGDRAGLTALGRYMGPLHSWTIERANDYPCQLDVTQKTNVIELLDTILNTYCGFWAFTRLGQFYYYDPTPYALEGRIAISSGTITVVASIVKDDIREGTFVVSHNAPGYASYQCYSNVNQTQQSTFASSLTLDDRAMFTRIGYPSSHFVGEDPGTTSYLGAAAELGGAPELYDLTLSDTEIINTIISGASDTAVPDAVSGVNIDGYMDVFLSLRRSLYLPWLEFIDFTVGLEFFELELGDIVQLAFDRYGLNAGILYQVCTVGIDASNRQVSLGLVRRRYAGVLDDSDILLLEDGTAVLLEDNTDIIL